MGEETDRCLDEGAEPHPATAYARTKLEAERLVLSWSRHPGRHACCLRLPMVYGVGSKGNLVRMIAAIDRRIFPPLPEVGNRRSLVHVGNVADAALIASERPAAAGQVYIVADARPWSTRELYEAICRALGRSVPPFTVPLWALRALARTGDSIGRLRGRRFAFDSDTLAKLLGSACFSPAKIARELGYQPSASLEEELPAIVGWYREAEAERSVLPPSA
jgi:nucleoside-diphosphate-sugar epimerase